MKNKTIGIIAGVLGLLLSMMLLIVLSGEINNVVIVTAVFVIIAYVGTLLFLCKRSGNSKTPDSKFLKLPAMTVGVIYMVLQLPLCIVFGLLSRIIPFRIALLINAIVAIVAWLVLLGSIAGTDHIEKVNSRQKDRHITQ